MRNSFNILLIALALFDNTYLVGSILESFRKRFQLITNLVIFPHFVKTLFTQCRHLATRKKVIAKEEVSANGNSNNNVSVNFNFA